MILGTNSWSADKNDNVNLACRKKKENWTSKRYEVSR